MIASWPRVLLYSLVTTSLCASISRPQTYAWKQMLVGSGFSVGIDPANPNRVFGQGANGGFYASTDQGMTWSLRSYPGIADIRQIVVHPSDANTLFITGFNSPLLKCTDGGFIWTPVIPALGIDGESIGLDPSHPDTMYAGRFSDGEIFRTTDRGDTWVNTGSTGKEICAIAVRPDSSNILLAGTGQGVISKSTDRGTTWRLVKPAGSDEIPRIVFIDSNPLIGYATGFTGADTTIGLWKTTDGGDHWTLFALKGISVWALDVDQSDPATIYVGTFSSGITSVFRTTDGGASWDSFNLRLPVGSDMWNLKVHPMAPEGVWLALANVFSPPSGIFRLVKSRAEVSGVVIDSVTSDTVKTGIVRLTSTGDSVNLASTGGAFHFGYFDGDPSLTTVLHIEAYPYSIRDVPVEFILDSNRTQSISMRRLATTSLTGIVRDSLTLQPLHAIVRLMAVTRTGEIQISDTADTQGHFGFSNLYVSSPPIVQYSQLFVDPPLPYAQRSVTPIVLDTSGAQVTVDVSIADLLVVAETDTGRLARYYLEALDSLRLTAHVWSVPESGPVSLRSAKDVRKKAAIFYTGDRTTSVTPEETDSLAAGLSAGNGLFMTGQNFVKANDTSSFFVTTLGVRYAANVTRFLTLGTAGDLFNGISFNSVGGDGASNQVSREAFSVTPSVATPILLYAGGGVAGVRVDSTAAAGRAVLFGFGFEAISTAARRKDVLKKVIDYLNGLPVTTVPTEAAAVPTEFTLEQNYPNPFNPSTNIRYSIPESRENAGGSKETKLVVYDVLGREVAVLVDETKTPGTYMAKFDASGLATGVYFYRLRAGEFVQARKMLVVK